MLNIMTYVIKSNKNCFVQIETMLNNIKYELIQLYSYNILCILM